MPMATTKRSQEGAHEDKKPKTPPPPSQQELLHLNDGAKLVVAMVGLPARGKTHVASKISNFFSWLGYSAKHFEVAQLRRERIGPVKSEVFFDPQNELGAGARALVRGEALDLIVSWLSEGGGQVAVYDTSNATVEQRKFVQDRISQAFPPQNLVRVIWVECQCDDAATIERNFLESTMKSPDFEGMTRQSALREFQKKMEHYNKCFVSMEYGDPKASFIKISDMGRRVVAQNAMGFLESKLVSFLTNIHLEPRVVLLARHGQTDYNVQNRVGGDTDLNAAGKEFAARLAQLCARLEAGEWTGREAEAKSAGAGDANSKLVLWTSIAKRAVQTGDLVKYGSRVAWNGLNEIDAGVCEGMTYSEIRIKMPLEYAERLKDKYHWRYPRGESYFDVTRRLEPVIFEIERQRRPVLVIAHRAVVRCLLGYFDGTPKDQVPFVPVPLHSVFKLTSGNDGWKSERIQLQPDLQDSGVRLLLFPWTDLPPDLKM